MYYARKPANLTKIRKAYGKTVQVDGFDIICHPKSGYLTTKQHGTSTCRCNNNAIFSDRAILKFPAIYVSRSR